LIETKPAVINKADVALRLALSAGKSWIVMGESKPL
jgi:hypothetical protein